MNDQMTTERAGRENPSRLSEADATPTGPSMDGPASGDPTGVRPARSVVGNRKQAMITKDDIILEPIKQWAHNQKAFLLKSRHNFSYGFIRKFHEDRYTKTPWQAFRGIGQGTQLIGSFYGPTGKEDAINAILKQL